MSSDATDDPEALAEASASTRYASDRHLLLQEIQSLAKEVARLRGDTKHLNEVVIPKEEHNRRRKVNAVLAGLSLLLFSIAMAGLYVQSQQIQQTQHRVAQATYEKCISDQARALSQAKGVVEINALLGSLRDAQTALAGNSKATIPGRQTASAQAAAYNRYLTFVRETVAAQQAAPKVKAVDCETIKP